MSYPWTLLRPIREQMYISFLVRYLHSIRLEAMIFYIYTGNIYFLPLRSRGAKVREKAKATHSMNHPKRPACSCKSIYRFAHEVCRSRQLFCATQTKPTTLSGRLRRAGESGRRVSLLPAGR